MAAGKSAGQTSGQSLQGIDLFNSIIEACPGQRNNVMRLWVHLLEIGQAVRAHGKSDCAKKVGGVLQKMGINLED
ncbi:MAG: hypothetical protein M0018_07320 [Nitrospiraceae bacterium]|nr:hypothetical protein [Nitrospiraceae bacterium]